MRGCHRCEHAAEVAAGKYRDVPWEETPCAACRTIRYAGAVEVDENEAWPEPPAGWVGSGEAAEAEGDRRDVDALPVAVLEEFVRGFMLMSPRARDAVCMRFQGWTYEAIGRRWGVSAGAVEMRLVRAVRQWPALGALFARKPASGGRRVR